MQDNNAAAELRQLQHLVEEWIESTGKGYFSVLTNTAVLAEETGEVARLTARLHGDQTFKNPADKAAAAENLADELFDVIFVAVCLANQNKLDLSEALARGMRKRNVRDASRHD